MNNNSFTFLSQYDVMSDIGLDIIKARGKEAIITDFSILLGGSTRDFPIKGGKIVLNYGHWWTESNSKNEAIFVSTKGSILSEDIRRRDICARPAVSLSLLQSISFNKVEYKKGVKTLEYGEYPQTIEDEDYSSKLNRAFHNNLLIPTGKEYTTDSQPWFDGSKKFKAKKYKEYEIEGKKYIRFIGKAYNEGTKLSDGRKIEKGKIYWVRVEPITWLVDEKKDIAISEDLLFAGVQFEQSNKYDGNFENTTIKQYMDTYFAKDIVPSHGKTKAKVSKKTNPYDFNFSDVSEEDIIKGAIESNVSVFLHGRSSEGKSARVKQLDPDCEILYMRNATPDSLNGKSVYNSTTGEMIDIPPTWYSKIKEKCEAEPNKIHIVFFDELTNALPSIQGMAFNIVLDGEVNGKWKLPENARIVAAGNDLNDSLAANQMAEPLFNRFAHVYINTTVDNWLKWASTPKEKYERLDYKEEQATAKIHPAIYAYVAYKSYSGVDVLRTPYTGNKPNADPRKWEMASKILYKTKQPEMLRALIGEELTIDFVEFSKQQVITVEDVIDHNYTDKDFEMDVSQKFATAVGLSSVDEENFEVVREFMKKVGAEPRAAFESMWTHGDERRLEILAEIQMKGLSKGGIRR